MAGKNKMNSYINLLNEEQIRNINDASLEILENIGIKINNEKAREIFVKHGCYVDLKTQIVKIPQSIVKELMASVPAKRTFYGREPKYDLTMPDDGPVFSTAGIAPYIIDSESGSIRLAAYQDIANIAHLVNEISGCDFFINPVNPNNVHSKHQNLVKVYHMLKNCLKPIKVGGLNTVEETEKILQLCTLVAGSEEKFKARPFVHFHFCNIMSPLVMDNDCTEVLIYLIEKQVPVMFSSVPNAGVQSPLSLIGSLAQANAEFLANTVLTQMIIKGTPVVYCLQPAFSDLRTGGCASGGIENAILLMGGAQMSRFYNIPNSAWLGITNSKIADAQAAYERTMAVTCALMAGLDMFSFGGLIEAGKTWDYGMLMIDNEIAQMMKRIVSGFENSEELRVAVDVITAVGPGGTFMDTDHTIQQLRTFPFIPEIADRLPREQWKREGALDARERALKKANEIIKRDNPVFFSSEVDSRIRSEFKELDF